MKTYIDNSKRENLAITSVNYSKGSVHIVAEDTLNGLLYQRRITPEFIKLLSEFEGSFENFVSRADKESLEKLLAHGEEIFGRNNLTFDGNSIK
jgi:hypothetical protein